MSAIRVLVADDHPLATSLSILAARPKLPGSRRAPPVSQALAQPAAA